MGLFGGGEDKEAAQAESDRLRNLPLPELAAAIMPAFGPDGINAKSGHQQGPMEVVSWLMRGHSQKVRYRQPLLGPTIEALPLLERAGLVTRRTFGTSGSTYSATRLGETSLADGTVGEQLATSPG